MVPQWPGLVTFVDGARVIEVLADEETEMKPAALASEAS